MKRLRKNGQRFKKIRKDANKLLEKARQGENRIIGNSLDAKLQCYTENTDLKTFLQENQEVLETALIVSQIEILTEKTEAFSAGEEYKDLFLQVLHADGEKCDRCWKYSTELGSVEGHPHICPRCSSVVE